MRRFSVPAPVLTATAVVVLVGSALAGPIYDLSPEQISRTATIEDVGFLCLLPDENNDNLPELFVSIGGGPAIRHLSTGVEDQPLFGRAFFEDGQVLKYEKSSGVDMWWDNASQQWRVLTIQE